MKSKLPIVLLALALTPLILFTPGCAYFGIGTTLPPYHASSATNSPAPTAPAPGPAIVSTGDPMKVYKEYSSDLEQINQERNKLGLPPQPILSFDDWMKAGSK